MTSTGHIPSAVKSILCGVVASTLAHADPATSYTKEIIPLLENYCYQCHGDGGTKGKFALDGFKDLADRPMAGNTGSRYGAISAAK